MSLLILSCIFGSNLSYGKDKVVAIIDTGLDIYDSRFSGHLCPGGHRDFTGEGLQDDIGHGTHVLGSIQRYAPSNGWCAVIVKFWGPRTVNGTIPFRKAIAYMLELRPDYVNYSGGGPEWDQQEYLMIKVMSKTRFIVATGNEGANLSKPESRYFPASYGLKNITPVGSVDKNGTRAPSSNYGLPYIRTEVGVNVLSELPCSLISRILPFDMGCKGYMSGTSMATSIATGKILKEDIDKLALNK